MSVSAMGGRGDARRRETQARRHPFLPQGFAERTAAYNRGRLHAPDVTDWQSVLRKSLASAAASAVAQLRLSGAGTVARNASERRT